jgi:hypothetical protein
MRLLHTSSEKLMPCLSACLIVASGCTANADSPIESTLDQDFQLRIGQSARISTEDMEIGFLAVTSDSRCGKGEVCITEGDATVRISLRIAGGTTEERELHTGSRLPSATDYANFSVGLVALHPAAISGQTIEPTAYLATFRVARGISGGQVIY